MNHVTKPVSQRISASLFNIGSILLFLVILGTVGMFVANEATAYSGAKPLLEASSRSDCNVDAHGVISVKSHFDVDTTVSRLEGEIVERGLGVFAVIDHQANADSVDLELRPTTLILFGNPNVGTVLMQSDQSIGIDLPQKFLVWEDACGDVHIGYNSPDYLKRRHRIRDREQLFKNIGNALAAISEAAANPE